MLHIHIHGVHCLRNLVQKTAAERQQTLHFKIWKTPHKQTAPLQWKQKLHKNISLFMPNRALSADSPNG